jgi:hypothetical protein
MRPGTVLSIRDRWENRTPLLLPRQRRQLSAQDFEVRVPTHVNIGSGGEKEAHFLRRGGPAGDLGPSRKPLGPVTYHPEANRTERRCSPCGLYRDRKDREAAQQHSRSSQHCPVLLRTFKDVADGLSVPLAPRAVATPRALSSVVSLSASLRRPSGVADEGHLECQLSLRSSRQ